MVALRCSDRAAELALSHFERGVDVSLKQDGTPVTPADRNVERLLVDGADEAARNRLPTAAEIAAPSPDGEPAAQSSPSGPGPSNEDRAQP